MEDFEVNYMGTTPLDEDTVLVTSAGNKQFIEEKTQEILRSAIDSYNGNRIRQSSVFTDDTFTANTLTVDRINTLAVGINSDLTKVLDANTYILQALNTNDLFGLAYSIMYSVINTHYKTIYNNPYKVEVDETTMEDVRTLIDAFNQDVGLSYIIRNAIAGTYIEGNYSMYLILDKKKLPQIQNYPLSLCYPSYYMYGNDRILEFNINDLKSKIRKTYQKTKKNKGVYYDNVDKEIKDNYPQEIYKGYSDGEKIVRLNPQYAKCLTINSFGKRFGVSPFFRALKSSIVMDNLNKADIAGSKSRSKIILFQKLSDKLLGNDGTKRGLAEQQLAHKQAAEALQTQSCLYTPPAFVESLEYITPKNSNTDSVNQMKVYTTKLLNALGISFYDSESATGTSVTVSYKGLLQIVNSMSESLAQIISRYYQEVLEFYGYDRKLAPTLKINPAEELDINTKIELAKLIYTTFNCSAKTSLEYLGLDLDDEVNKRQKENEAGVYEVLFPRATSYTSSGNDTDNGAGRPTETKTNDDGKQEYDKNYNQNERDN